MDGVKSGVRLGSDVKIHHQGSETDSYGKQRSGSDEVKGMSRVIFGVKVQGPWSFKGQRQSQFKVRG